MQTHCPFCGAFNENGLKRNEVKSGTRVLCGECRRMYLVIVRRFLRIFRSIETKIL